MSSRQRCSFADCDKFTNHASGVCADHRPRSKCSRPDCGVMTESVSGYCKKHSWMTRKSHCSACGNATRLGGLCHKCWNKRSQAGPGETASTKCIVAGCDHDATYEEQVCSAHNAVEGPIVEDLVQHFVQTRLRHSSTLTQEAGVIWVYTLDKKPGYLVVDRRAANDVKCESTPCTVMIRRL